MNEDERQQLTDAEHLRLLRLGYLISGAANAALAFFPVIHIAIGISVLLGAFPPGAKHAPPDFRFMGLFFVILGGAFSLAFGIMAVLKLMTARRLRERRGKTLCLVTAALSCLGLPYGTALGVFTFLVLNRPSIDRQFNDVAGPEVAG